MREIILKIEDLHKFYGKLHVLKGINLEVAKGEVISIIGPSGGGKSTLLRCINLLEDYQRGKILFKGEPITHKNVNRIRTQIGMVFQQFNLFPHLTVLENLTLAPLKVKRMSKDVAYEKAKALLERVGLLDKIHEKPANLSGGQQQRVAIARALMMDPELMLFDEPTSALDPELVKEVLDVIRDLVRSGMTTIIVTHEMRFAREISDKVVFLDDGKIVEVGSPEKIFTQPDNPRTREFLRHFLSV